MSDRITRLAAIDVGTNTALMVIADVSSGGEVTVVDDIERFVRLGEGVDATGVVGQPALHRLRKALLSHKARAEERGAEIVQLVGTSASRDARNKAEIQDFVRAEAGLAYEILSGTGEAEWSYRGALTDAFDFRDEKVLVFDLGAGSTEFTLGNGREGSIEFAVSVDIGAVRIKERFFSSDPPDQESVLEARAFIIEELAKANLPELIGVPVVGSNGTTVPLSLIHTGADYSTYPILPPLAIGARDISMWTERLLRLNSDSVLDLNPHLLHGRNDVFSAGVLILDCFAKFSGISELNATARGLRHGLLLRHTKAAGRIIR